MSLSEFMKNTILFMLTELIYTLLKMYYISFFLRLHANLTKGFGIMGPKEFFPLLDFAFMPKNALSSR